MNVGIAAATRSVCRLASHRAPTCSRGFATVVPPLSKFRPSSASATTPRERLDIARPMHARGLSSTPQRRAAAPTSSPGELIPTPLDQRVYEHISERDMEGLYEHLEELCESYGADGWEVEYSAGVLTLSLPPHGTYVLNKQPPNQQIWMSSPLSGPCRFGFVAGAGEEGSTAEGEPEGTWTHFRKPGVTLGGVLEAEVRGLCEESGCGEGWGGVGMA